VWLTTGLTGGQRGWLLASRPSPGREFGHALDGQISQPRRRRLANPIWLQQPFLWWAEGMNTSQAGAVRGRRTRQEVRQLVSAFAASGLGAWEFCQRHGLALSTLRRNLKRQRQAQGRAETGVRLVAVTLKATSESAARAALEVVLAGGRRIGVAPGFDEGTLGRLVRALEAL
jgi:hypothetical protein